MEPKRQLCRSGSCKPKTRYLRGSMLLSRDHTNKLWLFSEGIKSFGHSLLPSLGWGMGGSGTLIRKENKLEIKESHSWLLNHIHPSQAYRLLVPLYGVKFTLLHGFIQPGLHQNISKHRPYAFHITQLKQFFHWHLIFFRHSLVLQPTLVLSEKKD